MSRITLSDVIRKSCLVKRFSGEEIRGHRMSIAEHHYEVSMLVMSYIDELAARGVLLPTCIEINAIRYALVHDIPEIFTSDIPTPIKYSDPEFKHLLTKLEQHIVDAMMPEWIATQFDHGQSTIISILVKYADITALIREIHDEHIRQNHFTSFDFIDTMVSRLREKYIKQGVDKMTVVVFNECENIINDLKVEFGI